MEDFDRLLNEYSATHPTAWQDWKDEKWGKQRKWIRRRVAFLLADIQWGRFMHEGTQWCIETLQRSRQIVQGARWGYEQAVQYQPELLDPSSEWKTLEDDVPRLLPAPLSQEDKDTMFFIGNRRWRAEEIAKLESIHMVIPWRTATENTHRDNEGLEKYSEYITIPSRAFSNPKIPLLLTWYKEVVAFSCHSYRSNRGRNELFGIYILDTQEALEKFLSWWNNVEIGDPTMHQRIKLYIQWRILAKK